VALSLRPDPLVRTGNIVTEYFDRDLEVAIDTQAPVLPDEFDDTIVLFSPNELKPGPEQATDTGALVRHPARERNKIPFSIDFARKLQTHSACLERGRRLLNHVPNLLYAGRIPGTPSERTNYRS
jgi:hypothetical protein